LISWQVKGNEYLTVTGKLAAERRQSRRGSKAELLTFPAAATLTITASSWQQLQVIEN
jgi:hypothetical protein